MANSLIGIGYRTGGVIWFVYYVIVVWHFIHTFASLSDKVNR